MKESEVRRTWSKVHDLDLYQTKIDKAVLNDVDGFISPFEIKFSSGITAICGKNVAGKSTLMKALFNELRSEDSTNSRCSNSSITFNISNKNGEKLSLNDCDLNVYYLEPFADCNKIINFLNTTDNVDELLEGVDFNDSLNIEKVKREVCHIVGKNYVNIKVYELDGVFSNDPDCILPYFEVTTSQGVTYTNTEMGTGEFICLYTMWFLNWIEQGSILLIEEPENSISAYSQNSLIDYVALMSYSRKLWCIVTTHSEYILNKVGLKNTRVISDLIGQGSRLVQPAHKLKYLNALGIGSKFDGAILLEDSCALVFCREVLNRFNPYFLKEKELIGLDGESNIEKVIKHYKPHKKVAFDFLAVFDGDMNVKIDKLNSNSLSTISSMGLPSNDSLNPEEELWSIISGSFEILQSKLNLSHDLIADAYSSSEQMDHHDRFSHISNELNIPVDRLRATIIDIWLDLNFELAAKFSLSVFTFGNKMSKINLLSIVNKMKNLSGNSLEFLEDMINGLEGENFKVSFNGKELNFS